MKASLEDVDTTTTYTITVEITDSTIDKLKEEYNELSSFTYPTIDLLVDTIIFNADEGGLEG